VIKYEYYWRVEPGVHFFCDIPYDPFLFMSKNKKEYGFTVALAELMKTIPSLWGATKSFAEAEGLDSTTFLKYFANSQGEYNGCHFWSNFEIARIGLWNSDLYLKYFNFLDRWGGFFYER
jgi:alpha 1,2-mannosyltransferase